jgi:hypothetical protein
MNLNTLLMASACTGLLSAAAHAQGIPVPLAYNFNGIVHAGEQGLPDDPNGFRSISDRGLDFTAGVPADPLLNGYQIVSTPFALDVVHLGNRDLVSNGAFAFQQIANGDDVGTLPAWLPNVDQRTPQITILPQALPITSTTRASFLYQISNGGGAFDIKFTFVSGNSATYTASGGDWFGGTFLGTDRVDSGLPGANLSITQKAIDLSAHQGEFVDSITFENPNTAGGVAILGCKFDYPAPSRQIIQVPLNYNFNGMVHAGEIGRPDAPNGFRAISDRAINFSGGVPANPDLDRYAIVDQANVLDIVHLGNRNTVDNGNWAFDLTVDNDNVGVQPAWLTNVDQQSTPQVTTLNPPIFLDSASAASFLFQVSNGGGSFDITFTFGTAAPLTVTASGPDWFGGNLPGCDSVDAANVGAQLNAAEATFGLSSYAGDTLTSIAFSNPSNLNAGYAILGANVGGCYQCGQPGGVVNLGGGNGITMTSPSNGNLGCPLEWQINGGQPSTAGFFLVGFPTTTPIPFALVLPGFGCTGEVRLQDFVDVPLTLDATGSGVFELGMPVNTALCGGTVVGQYGQIVLGLPCPIRATDAIGIVIGD